MTKFLFFCCLSLFLLGCGSNEALFEVDMVTDFSISLGLNTIEAHYFVDNNVPTTLSTQLANINLDPSEVSQVVPSGATLRTKFGDNVNLDFIHNINVFIVDPVNLNDRTEIFFREDIPFGSKTEIQLLSGISNVTEKLLNNNLRIETRLEFRQFPPKTFEVAIDMGFSVFTEK